VRPKILVDSNFLYALFRTGDPYHPVATNIVRTAGADFIVPQVVLTEAAFLFNRAGGMPLVAAFLDLLADANLPLESVGYDDLRRASELLRSYSGTKLELVDCCIVALAERLNIARVATFDRRDFDILRTKEGRPLEIVP
jgi:predicted nucleic acid-binding protein